MKSFRLNYTKSSQRRQALALSGPFKVNPTEGREVMLINTLLDDVLTVLVVLIVIWLIKAVLA